MPGKKEGQAKVLTMDEQAAIFDALGNDRDRLIFGIGLYTGARISEIIALTWGDIRRGSVFYRKLTTKGKKDGRSVPINAALEELIENHRPADATDDRPIFLGRNHAPIQRLRAHRIFESAINAAGLEGLGISTHSMRRTFLTRLNQRGADLATMASMSGHKSLKVLQKYIEVDEKMKQNAIALL